MARISTNARSRQHLVPDALVDDYSSARDRNSPPGDPWGAVPMQDPRGIARSFSTTQNVRQSRRGAIAPWVRWRIDPDLHSDQIHLNHSAADTKPNKFPTLFGARQKCLPHKNDQTIPSGEVTEEEASIAVAAIGTAIETATAKGITTTDSGEATPLEIQEDQVVGDRRQNLHWDEKY